MDKDLVVSACGTSSGGLYLRRPAPAAVFYEQYSNTPAILILSQSSDRLSKSPREGR